MKKLIFGILFLLMLGSLSGESLAGWLIEDEQFHTSVHGQLSCRECHADVFQRGRHPDPDAVNKSLSDFFNPDKCRDCHEDVMDDIDQAGSHAGMDATALGTFENCIACHDPHYQMSSYADVTPDDLEQAKGQKCALCHAMQSDLPKMLLEDQACMACHREPLAEDPAAATKINKVCFHCHGAQSLMNVQHHAGQPFINIDDYRATPHAEVSCTACHPGAAAYEHADQPVGDCTHCHVRHQEKSTHDAHILVSCEACHLWEVQPQKDLDSGRVLWNRQKDPSGFSRVHFMPKLRHDASCMRCHFNGNAIGAAAMALPAKSIICMPCHTATFSMGDITTILSLVVCVIGILGIGSVWFSGSSRSDNRNAKTQKAVSGGRIRRTIKALLLDGLLQRRLFRVSRKRWLLHALVFYPFMFRFVWGLIALLLSMWRPEDELVWHMIDKNHPLTAFLFDLSGLVVIVGVGSMVLRRVMSDPEKRPIGLPPTDWTAFGLLGSIILVGFILEGMRMAMTIPPAGASWAFVGSLISHSMTGFDLTGIYGYVWYLHAILTGAFVAYLPFSRMLHMIMAPIVLAMNAAAHHD